jgi:hypothetical protein
MPAGAHLHPAIVPRYRSRSDPRDESIMRSEIFALLGACALPVGGCSTTTAAGCAPGEQSSITETLYFGRARPGGTVSDEDWSGFLRDVVTPRFPAGLTTWQATGQWRSDSGSLTLEDSFVVSLVHPSDGLADADVRAIVAEYKRRFEQEAVLRVRSPGCSSL